MWEILYQKWQTFENKVLRKIFGHKNDESSEQFRIFHHEELRGDLLLLEQWNGACGKDEGVKKYM
jgi:hypothetical protein